MNQKFDLRSQEWPILYSKCKLVGAVWRDLVSKNGTENKFTYYRGSVRDTYSPPWSLPGFELSLPNCWLLVNKRHLFATTKNTNLQRLVMKNVFRRRHHITSPAAITQMMASWDRHHVISWRVHLREFAQYGERWRWARSIQPKFRPVRPGKVVHVKRWTSFFETFPIGPNRSIEFWTKISGNFGRMDRALCIQVSYFFRVWQNRGKHYILLWKGRS